MIKKHSRTAALVLLLIAGFTIWGSAQLRQPVPVDPPIVLSGADVGFRVEAHRGQEVQGTLVVRINGQWVDAIQTGGVRRLNTN